MSNKPHYVNNKEFLTAMIEWNNRCKEAKEKGKKPPPITNYIGDCFLKIANRLSYRPNFINYTYREEMISDGIENCLQYVHNFNPEKSDNPFAYFTQIIYYAFVRRIQKEKKQTTIKHKLIQEANYDDMALQPGDDRDFKNQFTEFLQKNLPMEDTIGQGTTGQTTPAVQKRTSKVTKPKLKRVRKAKIDLEDFT